MLAGVAPQEAMAAKRVLRRVYRNLTGASQAGR